MANTRLQHAVAGETVRGIAITRCDTPVSAADNAKNDIVVELSYITLTPDAAPYIPAQETTSPSNNANPTTLFGILQSNSENPVVQVQQHTTMKQTRTEMLEDQIEALAKRIAQLLVERRVPVALIRKQTRVINRLKEKQAMLERKRDREIHRISRGWKRDR